ncbi:cytochrome C biogenesis protein [Pasteurellaceae bacterium Macca]|nr:cytochrome C biogenesis protein [Pasteurellaceae bacterium Macca]
MTLRQQLNQQHYQQGVNFAQQFANEEKQEYLAEIQARQAFEEKGVELALQKMPKKRPLVLGVFALAIGLIASLGYYWQTGRYEKAEQGHQAFVAFQQQKSTEDSQTRNDHYIKNLQQQLRQDPNNGERWFELGQAYSLNNDFEAAKICFQNAQGLLGETPAVLGAMATADYYQHRQKLTPQAKQWLSQALANDPKENASLLLLASNAFLNNDPAQAIYYWEKVLESDNPALNRREVIRSIRLARELKPAQ